MAKALLYTQSSAIMTMVPNGRILINSLLLHVSIYMYMHVMYLHVCRVSSFKHINKPLMKDEGLHVQLGSIIDKVLIRF